jgi:hypothetical protein
MPVLYALLIGIDDYPPPVPKLGGCAADAQAVGDFLRARCADDWELQICCLLDEAATKAAIVAAFRQHLGQAGAEDAVLVHFSGHGAQEQAAAVFQRFEPDGKLETLVCYDSGLPGGSTLADKELRYLLYPLAQQCAHLVTIFDCCHSGDNTRLELRPRLYRDMPSRDWGDFVFSPVFSPQDVEQASSLQDLLPLGSYVHLAACRDREVAYEVSGSGIFTATLLDVLQRAGREMSYLELGERLRHTVRGRFAQTPQITAFGEEAGRLLQQAFLGGAVESSELLAHLVFSAEEGWLINWGFLHGIPADGAAIQLEVLDQGRAPLGQARLGKVLPDRAIVLPEAPLSLDAGQLYHARIAGLYTAPLQICCSGLPQGQEAVEAHRRQFGQKWQQHNMELVHEPARSDYAILAGNNGATDYLALVPPTEIAAARPQPLAAPVAGFSAASAKQVFDYLCAMQRWRFLLGLRPEKKRESPIRLQIFESLPDGSEREIRFHERDAAIQYQQNAEGAFCGALRIKLTNDGLRAYSVALLYFSQEFGISPLLKPSVVELEAGQSVWVSDGRPIRLKAEPYFYDFRVPHSICWFKTIAATAFFDAALFGQDELPSPSPLEHLRPPAVDDDPSRFSGRATYQAQSDYWLDALYELRIEIPWH